MRILLAFAALFIFTAAQAQKTFQIYGTVTDSASAEKRVGSIISEKNGAALAVTNTSGSYSISVPEGKHILVFTHAGYEKKEIELMVNSNLLLNVELLYAPVMGEAKVVAEKVENIANSSQMGSISVPIQTIKKMPAIFGETDVLKVLQLLPGVKPGMEGTSGLYVRGGSPDQNLILLDGTPLYNVSHLYGFFSVFNTDALNQVELIKGGFPARYGGRLSSVLELTMKDGNMRKFRGSANLGLVSSNGTLEGPIWKNKISFIVSARRTYLDALYTPLMRAATLNPYAKQGYYFYDLNGKLNIKPNANHQILISSYMGDDKFYNNVKPYKFLYDGVVYENEEKDELNWGNRLASVRWNHRISPRLFGSAIANYTRYRYRVYQMSRHSEQSDTGVLSNQYAQDFRSQVRDWGARYELDYTPNNKHSAKAGMSLIAHKFSPGATVYNLNDPQAGQKLDSTIGSAAIQAIENYVFIEDDMVLGHRWKVNAGLHYSQFWVDKKLYHALQPRISMRYLLNRDWAIKASYARMQQYIHLLTNSTVGLPTDLWVPSTRDLKPEFSNQVSLGVAKTLLKKYIFTVEGYYKTMQNVLDYKNGATFYNTYETWYKKVEAGLGRSYGLEFFLQRKIGKLTGWVAYTLSKTDRKFTTINFGERFPFKYDSRHNIAAVMVYDINEKHTLSATWIYATGNAFTLSSVRFNAMDADGNIAQVETYDKRNQFRGADYHRLDISLIRHYPKKFGELNLVAGLYNAYSRRNPFYYQFGTDNYNNKVLYRTALFPILPFFSCNIVFK
ncbi:MAG: TonB-dependent receptor plug domain-containing protein [Bacteroidetes bacterium]|nr:TonB-dependent receptor plug domain-containing protein [Bacteroidota bacterium]